MTESPDPPKPSPARRDIARGKENVNVRRVKQTLSIRRTCELAPPRLARPGRGSQDAVECR